MIKHKKILTVALALVLAFLIPATSVSASTEWQQTYTATVLQNATYYYGSAGYNLTYGTFTVGSEQWSYVWYDWSNLTASEMETYLKYGSRFGTVTTEQGNICNIMYQWWLPLGSEVIAEDGYFTFYLGTMPNENSLTHDGSYFTFGDMFPYNAGSPAFTFQALDKAGYVDDLGDITYTIESYTNSISFAAKPLSWPTGAVRLIKVRVDCKNLSDYSSLGIRFWTWSNTIQTSADNISPYMYFAINPADMWITEPGETTPEGGESDTTSSGSSNQEILDEIAMVGSQLQQIESTLTVPDAEASSDIAAVESVLESQKEQFDTMLDQMQEVSVDFDAVGSVMFDIGIGNTYNPYDDSWLKALFGGLWANKYLLHMVVLATGMAMFGFVLFGKKA